jgi:hypothetical protein
MNILSVAVSLVAFTLVAPILLPGGAQYLGLLLKFRWWFLLSAMGWTFGFIYVSRRALELILRTPGARTRLRERRA